MEGFYPANVLKVRRIYTGENAENSDTYEYVDQTGKLIATETVVDENDRRITYYAYDDLGRKRFIIPPIQEALITVPGSVYSHVDLRKYCFYTEFDNRGKPYSGMVILGVFAPPMCTTRTVVWFYPKIR